MKHRIPVIVLTGLLLNACGEKVPQTALELLNRAENHRQAKETELALKDLQTLIEHFRTDSLAPKSQYLIGDIYMNDLRDFENAVAAYRKVTTDFINSPQEAHALFMIGYIQANILMDLDQARSEYNRFLQKFPDHELAPSVHFELDYLGKDINEIPILKDVTT